MRFIPISKACNAVQTYLLVSIDRIQGSDGIGAEIARPGNVRRYSLGKVVEVWAFQDSVTIMVGAIRPH